MHCRFTGSSADSMERKNRPGRAQSQVIFSSKVEESGLVWSLLQLALDEELRTRESRGRKGWKALEEATTRVSRAEGKLEEKTADCKRLPCR